MAGAPGRQRREAKLGSGESGGGGSAGTKLGVGRRGAYAGATAVGRGLGTVVTLLALVSVCVMTVTPACTRVDTAPLPPDSAARIACPAANDCWMVTSAGWVFHYTDGTVFPQNTDPAFASVINDRPNEAAAQFVPDTPPPDDSTNQITVVPPTKPKVKKIPPLIKSIRKPKVFAAPALHGYALVLTFYVNRTGKVQLLAYRHKKVVARTKLWKVHKGWATFRLLLFRNKWPTALAFILVEHGKKTCAGCPGQHKTSGGGGGGNTVSTAHDLGASGAVDSGTR